MKSKPEAASACFRRQAASGCLKVSQMWGRTCSCARLMHRRPDTLCEDAMIAATAIHHHLTVVTQNAADFSHFGAALFNRFDSKE